MFRKILFLAIIAMFLCVQVLQAEERPIDDKISELAQPLIDDGQVFGLAVGIIKDGKSSTYGFGKLSEESQARPDGSSLYEIGSISKVFTAVILAQMVQEGIIKLDDPLQKYLPVGVKAPVYEKTPILIAHLSEHTSALPRMPGNLNPKDPDNPYVDYTEKMLFDFLSNYKLTRKPGEQYQYSNYGVALLGHILAMKDGVSYEEMLKKRICKPLGMNDTLIKLDDKHKKLLAASHNLDNSPSTNWDLGIFSGAGGIRSNVKDMLLFANAALGNAKGSLKDVFEITQVPRVQTAIPKNKIGLGWHLRRNGELVWHNGQTGGYHAFLGINKKDKSAVVVLCNTASKIVDGLGWKILQLLEKGETTPLEYRKAAKVSTERLKEYPGKYYLSDELAIEVKLDADKLYAQATGQSSFRIYPESEDAFFYKVVDAHIKFNRDDSGKVPSFTLFQNGQEMLFNRDKPLANPENKSHRTEIKVNPEILKTYVGTYRLAPGVDVDVTFKDGALYAQVTGQTALQIFAESEKSFFYKIVDAQIEFVKDEQGGGEQLILHQNGQDHKAKKLVEK